MFQIETCLHEISRKMSSSVKEPRASAKGLICEGLDLLAQMVEGQQREVSPQGIPDDVASTTTGAVGDLGKQSFQVFRQGER